MTLRIKRSLTFLCFFHLLHRYTGTKCPLHLLTCLTPSGKLFAQISFLSSSGQACTGLTSQPHSCSDWGLFGKVGQARELISKYPVVAVHEARDLPGHSCSRGDAVVVVVVIVAPDISRWQDARDCTPQLSLRLQLTCAQEPHPSIVILISTFVLEIGSRPPTRPDWNSRYLHIDTSSTELTPRQGKIDGSSKSFIHSFIQSITNASVLLIM